MMAGFQQGIPQATADFAQQQNQQQQQQQQLYFQAMQQQMQLQASGMGQPQVPGLQATNVGHVPVGSVRDAQTAGTPGAHGTDHSIQQCAQSLNAAERDYYTRLWENSGFTVGANNAQTLQGQAAFTFLSKSNVARQTLRRIWELIDWQKRGYLTWPDFVVTMKLISAAQKNQVVSLERVFENSSPMSRDFPEFDGIKPPTTLKEATLPESESVDFMSAFSEAIPDVKALEPPTVSHFKPPSALPSVDPSDGTSGGIGGYGCLDSVQPSGGPATESAVAVSITAAPVTAPAATPAPLTESAPGSSVVKPDFGSFEESRVTGGVGSVASAGSAGVGKPQWDAFGADAAIVTLAAASNAEVEPQPPSTMATSEAVEAGSEGGDSWADFGGFSSSVAAETQSPAEPSLIIAPATNPIGVAASGSGAVNDGDASSAEIWADFGGASSANATTHDTSFGESGGDNGGDRWKKMSAFDDLLKEDEVLGGSIAKQGLEAAFAADAAAAPPQAVTSASVAAAVEQPPLFDGGGVGLLDFDSPAVGTQSGAGFLAGDEPIADDDDDNWGGFETARDGEGSRDAATSSQAASGAAPVADTGFDAFGDFDGGAGALAADGVGGRPDSRDAGEEASAEDFAFPDGAAFHGAPIASVGASEAEAWSAFGPPADTAGAGGGGGDADWGAFDSSLPGDSIATVLEQTEKPKRPASGPSDSMVGLLAAPPSSTGGVLAPPPSTTSGTGSSLSFSMAGAAAALTGAKGKTAKAEKASVEIASDAPLSDVLGGLDSVFGGGDASFVAAPPPTTIAPTALSFDDAPVTAAIDESTVGLSDGGCRGNETIAFDNDFGAFGSAPVLQEPGADGLGDARSRARGRISRASAAFVAALVSS
eukprot:TRINITY_DN9532_c0_g2_i1.p1 TRINITY_DN9532_c0_g2~~TRINITY_DN9532_c0_g2_i1.p1  ORF type:complete len:964 (+),score=198.82 TRINITY_DN9532_c0_g2_i1:260-2893(+)